MRSASLLVLVGLLSACDAARSVRSSTPDTGPVRLAMVSASISLEVGGQVHLAVVAYDAANRPVPSPAASWTSSAPGIVSVDTAGNVTGLAAGVARVTATAGTLSASAEVAVVAARDVSIQITTDPNYRTLVPGGTLWLLGIVAGDTGQGADAGRVVWSTSDSTVAALREIRFPDHIGTVLQGVSGGTTRIDATIGTVKASIDVTVLPALAGGSSTITVQDFHVIEFQYPGQPTRWSYAPMLTVEAAGGGIDILALTVTSPELGPAPFCGSIRVAPGQPMELNRELYGDYQISVDASGGRRAAPGQLFTATLLYRDASGELRTLTVDGPVVEGGLPSTYTGGYGLWGRCAIQYLD